MKKGLLLIFLTAISLYLFYYYDSTATLNSSPFLLLLLTLFRMIVAFVISVCFGIFFGYLAARSSRAEKLILPLLDVLQSVPIVGFFPLIFVLFLSNSNNLLALEISSIFLFFTSMAWNLAFGVFESLKNRDNIYDEVSNTFGFTNKMKFLKVYLPLVSPKMIYNSILSWGIAWFFLLVSEVISIDNSTFYLKGIGSFLAVSYASGDFHSVYISLILILASVVFAYIFIWMPLLMWSKSYYLKSEKSMFLPRYYNDFYEFLGVFLSGALTDVFEIVFYFYELIKGFRKKILYGIFYLIIIGSLFFLGKTVYYLLNNGFDSSLSQLPLALLFSFLRILSAYFLSLLWIFPVCYLIHKYNFSFSDVFSQILSSIPASALFPLLILVFSGGFLGEIGVVLMIMLGMMWYLFFNVLAGFSSISSEVEEASQIFNLNPFLYFKRVVFPAIMPSLIVGSVTAWGAGWNALVVSEIVSYGSVSHQVLGIGSLMVDSIAKGSSGSTGVILIVFVLVIILLNKLVWKKLFNASQFRRVN